MATNTENTFNMAVFCDLENVALGVRDARYAKFDIDKVLERLLLKGNIVVKKGYCDWDRYKEFKAGMHEAAFELIEIPHIRQSGKNSADIRMVVDALDLCYTKSHINAFVIISGDSDFSPLVSKLRENNKAVIGVGVKKSTSDLLISNCDEFIFYDDLVRETGRRKPKPAPARPTTTTKAPVVKTEVKEDEEKRETKRNEALNLVLETVEAIFNERGERKVWGSMVKQTLRRRKPGFNESYYGFRNFNQLLEEAESRKWLVLEKDQTSGGYIILDFGPGWSQTEGSTESPTEGSTEGEETPVAAVGSTAPPSPPIEGES
ncbi:MAG: NYN domain-containing protein [Nitrospirae bacterium]|nr:NYN domain-containing protein [Candidatus Manganitrophaceae bacterium]